MTKDNGREPRSNSERMNQRLLVISGVLGGVIGLALGVASVMQPHGPGGEHPNPLTSPLPAWLALTAALLWAAVIPIAIRWQRVVDEHEREAYRDGAVAGFYVMGAAAPIWWLLWRGGMAPAVDAVWLYAATLVVCGVVWMWRKYR